MFASGQFGKIATLIPLIRGWTRGSKSKKLIEIATPGLDSFLDKSRLAMCRPQNPFA